MGGEIPGLGQHGGGLSDLLRVWTGRNNIQMLSLGS